MADGSAHPLRLVVQPGSTPRVEWYAPGFEAGHLGAEARGFLAALAPGLPGLRFEDVPIAPPAPDLPASEIMALADAAGRQHGGPAIGVVQLPLGATFQRSQRSCFAVARAALDAETLPYGWVAAANRVDEIWVPSHFDRDGLLASGVTTRIEVIPFGVHLDRRVEPLAVAEHPSGAAATVFAFPATAALPGELHGLLQAWAEAFGPADAVMLVLGADLPAEQVAQVIGAATGREAGELAPVTVVAPTGRSDDLARLCAAADVVVVPSGGAGMRVCAEAMAAGDAVIATRWGAAAELIAERNALPVDIDGLRPLHAPGLPIHGLRSAVPAFASLVGQLRAATHPGLRARIGAEASADMAARTWSGAAQLASSRIDEIWSGLTERRLAPAGGLRVRWQGDHFRHTSLANVNRATSLGLLDRGCEVQVVSQELPEFSPHSDAALRPLVEATAEGSGPVDVEVHFEWPPRFERSGAHPLVVFQPWEFGPLPDEWVARAGDVDEFWTPSSWSRECFVMSGIPTDKVKVMPHGIDTSRYCPPGPRLPLRTRKSTKLLFVGGLIWRKGVDILLNAYLGTFTAADDVCLVIKSTDFYQGAVPDQIREVIRLAGANGMAEIEHIEEDLSEEALAGLYRACDALVHPYRGEGFGLPVLEAMACGLPVAVTAYGACMDFCDSTTAALIPCGIQGGASAGSAELKVSKPGFHAEPDPADLAAVLRRLVDDPGGNVARAARAYERVMSSYTIEASVQRVHEHLDDLVRRRAGAPAGGPSPELVGALLR